MTAEPLEVCGAIRYCGRWYAHRSPHGGFRALNSNRGGARGPLRAQASLLTPREFQIVRLLATGATWQVVVDDLKISRETVSKLLTKAKDKYGVTSMPELYAALGWLRVPPE